MELLIDAGNSRTKWHAVDLRRGLMEGDPQGSVASDELPGLGDAWSGLEAATAWLANVAGAELGERVEQLLPQGTRLHRVRAQGHAAGVTNRYDEPEKLGADRWAALIGARALFPSTRLVIASFGTASTIDVLEGDGTFAGGVILPGFELMRASLSSGTAGLPLARGRYQPLARATDDAITSGIAHAQAGVLERVLRLDEGAAPHAKGTRRVLLCGGGAAAVLPLLPFPATIVDNLVIRGLFEMASETLL